MLVLVGPCPFLCCFAVLLGGETQIWLGDLRVVFLAVVLVVWFVSHDDLPEIFGPHVSCTLLLFTAYAIVRTVPSANRPNRRKKKTISPMKLGHAGLAMVFLKLFLAKGPEAKTTQKTNTNKNNPHKTQKNKQPQSSDVTGSSFG